MHCPICNKELVETGNMSEDGEQKCPDNHYGYSHSYGQYEEWLNDGSGHEVVHFCFHYTEPDKAEGLRRTAMKAFEEYLKYWKNYSKEKKNE